MIETTKTMEQQVNDVLCSVGNQFFDFKEAKVQGITLEQLKRPHGFLMPCGYL